MEKNTHQDKLQESIVDEKKQQEEKKEPQEIQNNEQQEQQDRQKPEYHSQYDNYSARNFQQSNNDAGICSTSQSAQDLQNSILQQQLNKKAGMQPVDRPIPSSIKGKNQFICAGSLFTVDERYEFIKRIGYGAYGVVCSAHDKITNTNVAIKKIPKAFQDLVDAKRVLREIKILNIQRPPQQTGYDDVYIITELMEADMHKLIYSKQKLTDDHFQYFMYQLLRGVLFLHSANIMHRDLKPSNILVNMNCDLKICDFGLARGYGDEDLSIEKTIYVVTRWYRAPEVMLNQQHYTETLDVWSIGCIFGELMMKATLFQGQHNMKQLDKIIEVLGFPQDEDLGFINNEHSLNYLKRLPKKSPIKWEEKIPNANPMALDLLSKMLQFSPDKRITISQAILHPYFKNFHHLGSPPISETKFDWSWDQFELNKELLQKLIYMESLYFHPEENDPLPSVSTDSFTAPTSKSDEIINSNVSQKNVELSSQIYEHSTTLIKRASRDVIEEIPEDNNNEFSDNSPQKRAKIL